MTGMRWGVVLIAMAAMTPDNLLQLGLAFCGAQLVIWSKE